MKFPKKKPNHFKEKNKKDTRQVLSFEELPLDEYEKEQDAPKIKLDKKKVLIASGILVVLVLAVALYFSRGTITSCLGLSTKENFSKTISGSTVEAGNFQLFGKGVAYASDTSFVHINSRGEDVYKEQLKFISPMLSVEGKSAISYDLGGKHFAIFSQDRIIHKGETTDNIYLADITSDNSYAIITDVSDFNSKLTVYSSSHQVRYTYSFSEFYITSFALSENGNEAVVCGVTAEGGKEKSGIYILDFKEEEPKVVKTFSDDLIFDCDYLSQSSVCAVGSEGAYFLKGKNNPDFIELSYDQMTLTAYDINSDIGEIALSLSRSGDGRNCSVLSVNTSGKIKSTLETELKITSVSSYKDRVAVLDSNSLYVYNQSGKSVFETPVATNSKQVRMNGTSSFFVLGIDEIYHITS